MRRFRVIHLCVGLEMGGMEGVLVEFARHFDRRRFDLQFISLTTRGSAADDIERLGCPVVALHQRGGLRSALPLRLAGLFTHYRADLIHTHNTKALLYGVPAARLAGVRNVVHTRHGQRNGATARQTLLFNFAARYADHIVSVSSDSTRLAARQGLGAEKLVTIHNGIDLARFAGIGPHAFGPAMFVGRLSPEKDVPTLLNAAAIVAAEEKTFRLHIAGEGPIMNDLQRLAADLGLRDRAVFLGRTRNVAAAMAGASLFVLSSLTEGVSLALLEAMAMGLPAVATRVGGNVEVIVDGDTGLLVPPQSPQGLAAAMLKIYRDPGLARAMGQAGRQRVEANFDAKRMVARYEALYLNNLEAGDRPVAAA
jgi:glycosyltransferase involved in cell wall biosynthesis